MTALLLLGSAAGLAIALFAWRRRASHATPAFVVSALCISWWCCAEALANLAPPRSRAQWADLKYVGIVVLPASFLILTLRLTGSGHRVTAWLRLALCVVPVGTLALLFTNSRHHLFAVGSRANLGASWEMVWRPGPAFWAMAGYSYALLVLAVAILARNVRTRSGPLSWQMTTLVVAALVPIVANASHISHLGGGGSGRDPTPAALLVTLALAPVAMGRFRLLELMPADSDAIFSEVPEGLLVLDAADRVVDANRAAATMLGRSRSDLVGEAIATLLSLSPSDLSVAGGAGFRLQLRAGAADERHIDLKIAGVRQPGSPYTRVAVLHDSTLWDSAAEVLKAARASATERWRVTLRALEASEIRYQALFEVLPHPLFVYDPETLAIQASNLTAAESYAYDPAGAPPGNLRDLWADEEADHLRRDLTLAAGPRPLLVRHQRRNGSTFEAEIATRRVRPGDGSGHLLLAVDVTERRRAESEGRRLNEEITAAVRLWRGTADALDSPLLLVDSSDRIVRLNRAAAEAIGLDVHGTLPRPIPEAAQGEPWSTVLRAARAARETRAGVSLEVDAQASGRSWSVLASPAAQLTPEQDWVVVVVHETTRLVKLQAALRRQESFALVGSVVAAVAHDVRNPLAILSVSLDALEIDFEGDPRLQEGLEPLRRSITRLTDLMQALLAYGSPASQERADVNVPDLIASVHASLRPRARDVSVTLKVSLTPPRACVVGQHDRLLRVFENLIDNAIQFAPDASEVTVEVERLDDADGAWVRCQVRDRGPGFDPSAMPRLFEPFFTTRRGGTGLGLASAQRIVEQHGGRIAAANAPGGGALVTVDLPLADHASSGVRR